MISKIDRDNLRELTNNIKAISHYSDQFDVMGYIRQPYKEARDKFYSATLPHVILSFLNHIDDIEAKNQKYREALECILEQFPKNYEVRITEIAREALKGEE